MRRNEKPILVSTPSLSSLEKYVSLLESVWNTGILTHNGPLVRKLENEICKILKVKNCVAVSNGTIALQMAIRALGLRGEIITTPFSWIATVSAIMWERCKPVFVDIDQNTFNIDPDLIEAAITNKTSAILPVHVFGNPVEIKKIEGIARKHNLKIIYDAAHAFGVNHKEKSILSFGDISITSFHATKLFNTAEGGACFTQNDELFLRLQRIRFFGHDQKKKIVEEGFNGKMTEVHAALGLANLKIFKNSLKGRKNVFKIYKSYLCNLNSVSFQEFNADEYNYSYMPIVFENEKLRTKIELELIKNNFIPRRYFDTSLNTLDFFKPIQKMKVSESLSKRIL